MMGRSHITGGTAITAAGLSGLYGLTQTPVELIADTAETALHWLIPVLDSHTALLAGFLVLAALLHTLGTLLPDIDQRRSIIGRHLPWFPGPHRGIMNSYWIMLPFIAISLFEPMRAAVFIAIGIWTHIELDGLSKAGSVRLFPLWPRWKTIRQGGGANAERIVVLEGYKRGYKTGDRSEYMTFAAVIALCAAVTMLSWWSVLS